MAETLKQLNQYPGQGGRPKVLIVGAGLAGLTLGMLLHKAGIPFEIYERAAVVKPLGKFSQRYTPFPLIVPEFEHPLLFARFTFPSI